jgi:hypothetical protein
MSSWKSWLVTGIVVALGGAAATMGGCTGDTNNNYTQAGDASIVLVDDGGVGRCSPGAKECVSDTVARVCPQDGNGWLSVPCVGGTKCEAGECKGATLVCTPGAGACTGPTTALRCKDDGSGYAVTTCPANTTCTDGRCAGACVVGSSTCLGVGYVGTCADGQTYTTAACATGELCVATGANSAACKPAACAPDANGCDTVCGNKNDTNADQTKFVSVCRPSPTGYRWVAVGCPAPTTCDSLGAACGNGRQATCASDCIPGDVRCSPDGLGQQTCDANGKWPTTSTPCNANTQTSYRCFTSPVSGSVVCGDQVCAANAGACEANGNFRACGANGRLGTGAACATGRCEASGAPVAGQNPGRCVAECEAGDERCYGVPPTTAYQTCANGLWASPQTCANAADGGATRCIGYTTATGRPARVCGECAPGTHRCGIGADGGVDTSQLQTCQANGTWGANAACAVGLCATFTNGAGNADAECRAQCVPGQKVCVGAGRPVPGVSGLSPAPTEAEVTCTAGGAIPPAPDCAADAGAAGCCPTGQSCRRSSNGASHGCRECVGPGLTGGNELGDVDSRCYAADGGASTTERTTCGANNTWAGGATAACPPNTTCATQSLSPPQCDPCLGAPECTERVVLQRLGMTCAAAGGGPAISCGSRFGGTVPDCCAFLCNAAVVQGPAYCR